MWRAMLVAAIFAALVYGVVALPAQWKLVAASVALFVALVAALVARAGRPPEGESPLETIRRVLSGL